MKCEAWRPSSTSCTFATSCADKKFLNFINFLKLDNVTTVGALMPASKKDAETLRPLVVFNVWGEYSSNGLAHYDAGVHRSRGIEHGVRYVIGVLVRILEKVACGTREPTFSGGDTIPLNYWFLTGQQRGRVRIVLRRYVADDGRERHRLVMFQAHQSVVTNSVGSTSCGIQQLRSTGSVSSS